MTALQADRPLVLVADDDADILAFVEFRLEREGYEVATATDGIQALGVAVERHPDVAILDIMMPHMDGVEVTRRIRADEELSHTPVILLTASVADADRVRGAEAGADDFLQKPFDKPEQLIARVQEALAKV
jgi:CheY-like chemotaxis protein